MRARAHAWTLLAASAAAGLLVGAACESESGDDGAPAEDVAVTSDVASTGDASEIGAETLDNGPVSFLEADPDLPARASSPALLELEVLAVRPSGGLHILDTADVKAALSTWSGAPETGSEGGSLLDPVATPALGGGDAAEIWLVAQTDDEACEVRAFTRAGALVDTLDVVGACLQPGGADHGLVLPVATSDDAGAVLVVSDVDGQLGVAAEVALDFAPTAPTARLSTGGSHWLVAGHGALAVIDAHLGVVSVSTGDLDGTPGHIASAGDRVVVTTRTAPIQPAALGDRLLRYAWQDGALVRDADIVPPGEVFAAPLLAAPGCAVSTGGSHWWCGDGVIATGGSHWHGGWSVTSAEALWESDTEGVITGLALGDDGRIYTGGSHWLTGGSWQVTALEAPVDGAAAESLVLEQPATGPTWVSSPLLTCGGRLTVQVSADDDASPLIVSTDVPTAGHPAGTWARTRGDAAQRSRAADETTCPAPGQALATCGDGVVDPGELCDDDNTVTEIPAQGLTACSADCRMAWYPAPQSFPTTTLANKGVGYRGDLLVDGLHIHAAFCLPFGQGPHPVAVVGAPGQDGINGDIDGACLAGLERGLLTVVPQLRGQGAGGAASEGQIEFCAGEVRDVAEALRHTLSMPTADPTRVGVFGVADSACVMLQLIERAPELLGDAAPVFLAAALVAPLVDAVAFWEHASTLEAFGAPALVADLEAAAGGTPDQAPGAYALRSPLPQVATLLAPDPPPAVLVFHTVGEPMVVVEQGCALRGALAEHGGPVRDARLDALGQQVLGAWPLAEVPGCEDGVAEGFPSFSAGWLVSDRWFVAVDGALQVGGNWLGALKLIDASAGFLASRLHQ